MRRDGPRPQLRTPREVGVRRPPSRPCLRPSPWAAAANGRSRGQGWPRHQRAADGLRDRRVRPLWGAPVPAPQPRLVAAPSAVAMRSMARARAQARAGCATLGGWSCARVRAARMARGHEWPSAFRTRHRVLPRSDKRRIAHAPPRHRLLGKPLTEARRSPPALSAVAAKPVPLAATAAVAAKSCTVEELVDTGMEALPGAQGGASARARACARSRRLRHATRHVPHAGACRPAAAHARPTISAAWFISSATECRAHGNTSVLLPESLASPSNIKGSIDDPIITPKATHPPPVGTSPAPCAAISFCHLTAVQAVRDPRASPPLTRESGKNGLTKTCGRAKRWENERMDAKRRPARQGLLCVPCALSCAEPCSSTTIIQMISARHAVIPSDSSNWIRRFRLRHLSRKAKCVPEQAVLVDSVRRCPNNGPTASHQRRRGSASGARCARLPRRAARARAPLARALLSARAARRAGDKRAARRSWASLPRALVRGAGCWSVAHAGTKSGSTRDLGCS